MQVVSLPQVEKPEKIAHNHIGSTVGSYEDAAMVFACGKASLMEHLEVHAVVCQDRHASGCRELELLGIGLPQAFGVPRGKSSEASRTKQVSYQYGHVLV